MPLAVDTERDSGVRARVRVRARVCAHVLSAPNIVKSVYVGPIHEQSDTPSAAAVSSTRSMHRNCTLASSGNGRSRPTGGTGASPLSSYRPGANAIPNTHGCRCARGVRLRRVRAHDGVCVRGCACTFCMPWHGIGAYREIRCVGAAPICVRPPRVRWTNRNRACSEPPLPRDALGRRPSGAGRHRRSGRATGSTRSTRVNARSSVDTKQQHAAMQPFTLHAPRDACVPCATHGACIAPAWRARSSCRTCSCSSEAACRSITYIPTG